jgi:transcriptional regulator with XRE-family HTH domain
MKTLKERIEQILSETKISQAQLARDAGVSKSMITFWRNESVQTIDIEAARKIGRLHNFNPQWIALGEGDPHGRDDTFGQPARSADLNRLLVDLQEFEAAGPPWDQMAAALSALVRRLHEAQTAAQRDGLTPEMRDIVSELAKIDHAGGERRAILIANITDHIRGPRPRKYHPKKATAA